MTLPVGFPRFRDTEPKMKPARKRLPRVGKKGKRDAKELHEARPLLIERSRGRCEARCSRLCTGIGVHAHHIRRRSQGGDNSLDNLLWVDAMCHDAIHAMPDAARQMGFLR